MNGDAHYHMVDGVLTYAFGHTSRCDICNPPSDAVRAPISEVEIMGHVFTNTPDPVSVPRRPHRKRVISNTETP